jgi:hypothetical protein
MVTFNSGEPSMGLLRPFLDDTVVGCYRVQVTEATTLLALLDIEEFPEEVAHFILDPEGTVRVTFDGSVPSATLGLRIQYYQLFLYGKSLLTAMRLAPAGADPVYINIHMFA